MRVIVAEAMGLCFGVRDALAAARGVAKPVEVTVFGQLVHNPAVDRELAGRGFVQAGEKRRQIGDVQTPEVLITAHGISDRERAEFLALGKRIIDTTCPLVRRAHAAERAFARSGHFVVVIGRRGHVEVRGLTGDLDAACFEVVETERDVRRFPADRIGIVVQTTAVEREAKRLARRIEAVNPQAQVRFANTICQPTRDRQAALEKLLQQVDVLVVVGGKESNNTRQLVGRALEAGVRAVHVEDAGELREAMFAPGEVVGLTAGTSTLPETVEAARQRLEGFFNDLRQQADVPISERSAAARPGRVQCR